MAWRCVSSFVSSALGPVASFRAVRAAITHTTAKLNLRASATLRRRLNRTFVVPTLR